MKTDNPFGHSIHVTHFASALDTTGSRSGVPRSNPEATTLEKFSNMVLSIARVDSNANRHVCAQYLAASCPGFARVASVIHSKLAESWPGAEGAEWSTRLADEKFLRAFEREMDRATIRIIPWLGVDDWERPGPGKHRLTASAWLMINPSPKNRPAYANLPAKHRDAIDVLAAHQQDQQNAVAAPWDIGDCESKDLFALLRRRQVAPNSLLPNNMRQAKTWAPDAIRLLELLDLTKRSHRYIVWIAAMTALSCPSLTVLEAKSDEVDKARWKDVNAQLTPDGVTRWLQQLPLSLSQRRNAAKGRTDPVIIQQCFVIYYLAHALPKAELKTAGIQMDWLDSDWREKLGLFLLRLSAF